MRQTPPKIAIVVGHNVVAQGAVRVTDGMTEWKFNSRLAELIQAHDPDNIRLFYRQPGGGFSAEIDRVYRQVNDWGATVSAELHFNSVANRSARGCETLSSGSSGSRKLAAAVQAALLRVVPGPDRGVKIRNRRQLGGRQLHAGRAPAVLLEPFFGSHAPSCHAIDEAIDELAEAIFRGLRAGAGAPVGRTDADMFTNAAAQVVIDEPVNPEAGEGLEELDNHPFGLRPVPVELSDDQITEIVDAIVDRVVDELRI